jgi:tyrosyl-tRNA synthetase
MFPFFPVFQKRNSQKLNKKSWEFPFPGYLLAMRILSGIQPSGALHLGNYFGMMKPAIELQEKGEAFYFIANYHSMTSLFDPAERRKNTPTWRWTFWRAA